MPVRWRVYPSQERALAPPVVAQAPRIMRIDTAQLEPMILSRLRTRPAEAAASVRRPERAHPPAPAGSFLRGALSTLPPAELLEYLSLLRRPGSLVVKAPDGTEVHCEITENHLLSARLGRLKDAEAVLELLSWTEGTFELRPVGAPTVVRETTRLATLRMEHARLTDELERRAHLLPPEGEPLVLRLGQALPVDHAEGGLEELAALLTDSPGLCLGELEAQAPVCRLKVRLAVALLAEAGCL